MQSTLSDGVKPPTQTAAVVNQRRGITLSTSVCSLGSTADSRLYTWLNKTLFSGWARSANAKKKMLPVLHVFNPNFTTAIPSTSTLLAHCINKLQVIQNNMTQAITSKRKIRPHLTNTPFLALAQNFCPSDSGMLKMSFAKF